MSTPRRRQLADVSAVDRTPIVDRALVEALAALPEHAVEPAAPPPFDRATALGLWRSQLESRHVDLAARALKKEGASFYTIGSSGHEGNAAVAAALRVTDPALLHYRSGGFFFQRARQGKVATALYDVLCGVTASRLDPIAGGRHKVWGSRRLSIPPQTSTIASHLPKAVGMAFAIERERRLGVATPTPRDAIVVCTFGDASANHSTAAGAINAACWAAYQGLGVPLLFVCEDNGLGISVPTPSGWIAANYRRRPGLRYFHASGTDIAAAYRVARQAVDHVRDNREPAFLHLSVVRMLGHAGSDVESLYRSLDQIEAVEARDPVIATARQLHAFGFGTGPELAAIEAEVRAEVAEAAARAAEAPKLETAGEIMEPLAPRDDVSIATEVARPADAEARAAFWDGKLPEDGRPMTLAAQLNRTLGDLLVRYPGALIFGEDVGRKGGVYGVTRGLQRRARRGRVFDTLLDEQTILGVAIGAGQLGALPFPEIQYLAYLHNAEDQLRGEAATLQFFSRAKFANPMVVRIASYAYQKGFGGHFHNDNSVAVLRDIPGLVIASPARGEDAAAMLRTCAAAAETQGSVCVFLEPIALYPERDLYEKGDGGWLAPYDPAPAHVPIGKGRTWGDGEDLLLVSWANGLRMSLRAARALEAKHGVGVRVLDLRWLAPLPIDDLLREANAVKHVLIVDETRRTGGVSEALMTALVEGGVKTPAARIAGEDSFIPLGAAANRVLIDEDGIASAAERLLGVG